MHINKKFLQPRKYWNHLVYKLFLPKKSYSQVGEDMIINFFLNDKKDGFYVDIGANHPKRFSNTAIFYKKGWSGINIEPDPKNFRRFKWIRRRDINLNLGISKIPGCLDFYAFKSDTLSTFSKESADNSLALGYEIIGKMKIQTMPLQEVLAMHIPPGAEIDFFSVDTEGLDEEVLKSNDWESYRPKFIIIEAVESGANPGESIRKSFSSNIPIDNFMMEIGYLRFADTYINSIYIEKNFAKSQKINF